MDQQQQDEPLHPVDVHVGERVRMRRKMLGMSQETLGLAMGISSQQIQKYERGANRISASKLFQAAGVLSVPISYFFDGLPSTDAKQPDQEIDLLRSGLITRFLNTSEGLDLASLFPKIQSGRVRRQILAMCKSMADAPDLEAPQDQAA